MTIWQQYKNKLVSAEQAVQAVKSGDWVDYDFALACPVELDAALARRKNELQDVKIRGAMRCIPLAVVEADPGREHFTYNSWHLAGYERQLSDKGLCSYLPMVFRNMPLYYRKSLEVDVHFRRVSPMDERGWFNFSFTNAASKAIFERAKINIVEVNNNLPAIKNGSENAIHIDDVDLIVESANQPLETIAPSAFDEVEKRIASYIIERITDGTVIQLGVGGLPNAVGSMLSASNLKNLGMHTEMLVEAYKDMHVSGILTNKLKAIDNGLGVFSFCMGSADLYEWARENAHILSSQPINYVNDPGTMSAHHNLVAINNCISVDLRGQVTSETAGYRQISGTGGQLDFVTGGYQAIDGQSFVCFTSTYKSKKTGELQSRITCDLPMGTVVTNPRSLVHCLVTEWGVADLAGRSLWERAERIINIAHPNFRDGLIKDAHKAGLWRRSNKVA